MKGAVHVASTMLAHAVSRRTEATTLQSLHQQQTARHPRPRVWPPADFMLRPGLAFLPAALTRLSAQVPGSIELFFTVHPRLSPIPAFGELNLPGGC